MGEKKVVGRSYTPSKIGTFQVRALFSGATNYSQSTSLTSSLNVGMDYNSILHINCDNSDNCLRSNWIRRISQKEKTHRET